jgi:hypothetical protein
LAGVGVTGVERAKNGIDRLEQDAADSVLAPSAALDQAKVVVNINVDVLERLAAGTGREISRQRSGERWHGGGQLLKRGLGMERERGLWRRGRRGGSGVQTVRWWLVVRGQCGIGKVGTGLGGCGEPRGACHPPHGASEGKGDEESAIGSWRKGNAKGKDVAGAKVKAIEAIGDILLAHEDGAMARIGVDNALEETGKCASELHRFRWREADGLLVQIGVAVVDDGARPAFMLWDDAGRRNTQGGLFAYERVREDHPLAARNHGSHFFGEKLGEFHGGFVGAALHGFVLALESPGSGAEFALYADVAHVLEEAGCLVGERANVLREVCWGSKTAYRVFPALSPKEMRCGRDVLT